MKMKLWDRLQAVRRSSTYKRDYEVYLQAVTASREQDVIIIKENGYPMIHSQSDAGRRLCQRYKIPFVIKPDDSDAPSPFRTFPPVMEVPRRRQGKMIYGPDESGYITVKIDSEAPMEEIEKWLKIIRTDYEKLRGQTKKERDKGVLTLPNGIDIWDVYDRYVREKNFTKVAREVFNVTGHPTYDDHVKARLETIRRAYKQAVRRIKEVTPHT